MSACTCLPNRTSLLPPRLLPFTAAKREARQLKKQYRPPKPGEAVYKGHRSYDLMRELQLGLTFSIAQAEVGWAGRAHDTVGSLAVLGWISKAQAGQSAVLFTRHRLCILVASHWSFVPLSDLGRLVSWLLFFTLQNSGDGELQEADFHEVTTQNFPPGKAGS